MIVQAIKDWLVDLGPNNGLVRVALKLQGKRAGTSVEFSDTILLRRDNRAMRLAPRDFYLVPMIFECFDRFFNDMVGEPDGAIQLLDFSRPAVQKYKSSGLCLRFPGIPEEDSTAAYTWRYKPGPGELVFDVGAHAGFTSCVLARMVGENGRVVAFEPDATCAGYITENALRLGLRNITVVCKAIDARTGTAVFNADGTMGAGLAEHSVYAKTGNQITVDTLSLEDACKEYGVPDFMKIDIEGAEVVVIQSALEFLRKNPIKLAFDSGHRMRDGRLTWTLLEPMLQSIGYETESSTEFGEVYTWAQSPRVQALQG